MGQASFEKKSFSPLLKDVHKKDVHKEVHIIVHKYVKW